MSYHLTYPLDTPTGTYRAGLEVWITKRTGDQITVNLAPKGRPPVLASVEREMLRYQPDRRAADPLAPCGTASAYQRHRHHLEDPCTACEAAWSRYRKQQNISNGTVETIKVDVHVLAELYLAADLVTQQMVESALGTEVMTAVVARWDSTHLAAS